MEQEICLGLGSNQGDRLAYLNRAVNFVVEHPDLQLIACSSVYETDYVGPGQQDKFLNGCLALRSNMALLPLLDLFQALERDLGRGPDGHMKPRPLDVDILLVDDLVMTESRLTVPHPRLAERLFVLEPLCEIAPGKIIPKLGETVANLCAKIKRKDSPAVTLRLDLVLESGLNGRFMED